ncbi:DNA-binding LytR/AlgR family response regulator [Sphingobacterium detergens]|uniref:DNA-binding LytR/AlgR family response regulator n=2 Tax=Sphingobacterium detergens TaxID=1145106 RepID=A0A420B6V6_SPHD1|nr:DNA-binding LytR/AlgR family response regulator [Sphingobacterium detergens]
MTSCYIVDKSESSTKKLVGLISQIPELVLLNTHTDLERALKEITKAPSTTHILFVALDESNTSGKLANYDFYKEFVLVVVGSNDHFYKDAFELGAAGYLSKPIKNEDFTSAIEKCKARLISNLDKRHSSLGETVLKRGSFNSVKISLNQVLFIEMVDDETLWHMIFQDLERSPSSDLDEILKKLSPKGFVRINEAVIVNKFHINKFKGNKICLINGNWFEMEQRYVNEFYSSINII